MGKKMKHRMTRYSIDPATLRNAGEEKLKEKLDSLYRLAGKTVIIKSKNMKTPPFKVVDVEEARDVELGRILHLIGEAKDQKIPIRFPDVINVFEDRLELVYESKLKEEDPEILFKRTRSDRKIKEDTVLEILLVQQ